MLNTMFEYLQRAGIFDEAKEPPGGGAALDYDLDAKSFRQQLTTMSSAIERMHGEAAQHAATLKNYQELIPWQREQMTARWNDAAVKLKAAEQAIDEARQALFKLG